MTDAAGALEVDPAALVGHAREVDQIADGFATAAQAGETVRTAIGAYGVICQLVPVLLNELQVAVLSGVETAATSARDTATSLRDVAAAYDRSDTDAADRLGSVR